MRRRDFVKAGAVLASSFSLANGLPADEKAPEAERPRLRVIDAHCHAGRGLNFGKDGKATPAWTTFNDPEWLLRKAAEVGIDQSIIFPISNTTYEKANEEIAGYVRKYKGKFIGFAKHDPKTEVGKIKAQLTREVRELGLKGLKLHGVPSPEMLETVAALQIPIIMHPPRVEDCLEVVRTNPKINFILAHLGSFASREWKDHVLAIESAKVLPNLYLESSSVVFFDYLEQAAKEIPDQFIFGSDGPLVDPRVELYKIRLLKLPREKEEKVLSGTIRRLLGA
jgi:uncharacterized protein